MKPLSFSKQNIRKNQATLADSKFLLSNDLPGVVDCQKQEYCSATLADRCGTANTPGPLIEARGHACTPAKDLGVLYNQLPVSRRHVKPRLGGQARQVAQRSHLGLQDGGSEELRDRGEAASLFGIGAVARVAGQRPGSSRHTAAREATTKS